MDADGYENNEVATFNEQVTRLLSYALQDESHDHGHVCVFFFVHKTQCFLMCGSTISKFTTAT